MANQPLLTFLSQKAGMPVKEIGNLGLDGIGQKLPRPAAQNFSKWILKCTWLGEFNDIILGHGVSSFNGKWSFEHPTIRRLTSLCRHQLSAIAQYVLADWPVIQALTRAADRGVKVRIYLDAGRLRETEGSKAFQALAETPSVEIRVKQESSALNFEARFASGFPADAKQ